MLACSRLSVHDYYKYIACSYALERYVCSIAVMSHCAVVRMSFWHKHSVNRLANAILLTTSS
jgi:hypothetical protein